MDPKIVRIVATADLHGDLPHWRNIPECDLLLIAGDVCFDKPVAEQRHWLLEVFTPWLEALRAKHIIGIAGNHDFIFERDKGIGPKLPWHYLEDQYIGFYGIHIWGTPWVPNLSRWAFHGTDAFLDEKLQRIPEYIDIVMGHGPPHMHCDYTAPQFGNVHAGFPGTLRMLDRVRPALYICGHIHEGFGWSKYNDTLILNVAHLDEHYDPSRPFIYLEWDKTTRSLRYDTALPDVLPHRTVTSDDGHADHWKDLAELKRRLLE